LIDVMGEKGIEFSVTSDALKLLAQNGYDPAFGARPLKRLIQKELTDRVANMLLSEDLVEGDKLEARVNGAGIEIMKL